MTVPAGTIPSTDVSTELEDVLDRPQSRPPRRPARALVVGGLLLLVCWTLLSPVLWTAMTVTKPTNVAFVNPPQFLYEPTFDSFVNLWQTTQFYSYLMNTLVVAVVSTVFALLFGVPAG